MFSENVRKRTPLFIYKNDANRSCDYDFFENLKNDTQVLFGERNYEVSLLLMIETFT